MRILGAGCSAAIFGILAAICFLLGVVALTGTANTWIAIPAFISAAIFLFCALT